MIYRLIDASIELTRLGFIIRIGFFRIGLPVRHHCCPLGYRDVVEGIVMIRESLAVGLLHFNSQI